MYLSTLAAMTSTFGPLTAKSNIASNASLLLLCISAGGSFAGDLFGVVAGRLGDFFLVGMDGRAVEGLVSSEELMACACLIGDLLEVGM